VQWGAFGEWKGVPTKVIGGGEWIVDETFVTIAGDSA